MKRQKRTVPAVRLFNGVLVMLFATSVRGNQEPVDMTSTSPITLHAGNLRATFADNSAYGSTHRKRYNGISELYHTSATDNLFVPLYAGFNLEHIFGGDHLEELFEPREHPMILRKIDETSVCLYQPPTPRSKVETETFFTLHPPHFIDVHVKVTLHDLSAFQHGYAGLFWASYINTPEDRCIYFWGTSQDNAEPHWIRAYSERHGLKSTHLFAEDRIRTWFAPDFNVVLAKDFSDYRYLEPFYFGRRGKMVYAIFFDRTDGIRFSQSPTGGGDRNPAWDHHWIIPNPEPNHPYTYRARLMYKEFLSNEDIRNEFKRWWKETTSR